MVVVWHIGFYVDNCSFEFKDLQPTAGPPRLRYFGIYRG